MIESLIKWALIGALVLALITAVVALGAVWADAANTVDSIHQWFLESTGFDNYAAFMTWLRTTRGLGSVIGVMYASAALFMAVLVGSWALRAARAVFT